MLPNQPSRTLLRTAIRRATHQVLDTPTILHDPIVLKVLPEASDPEVIASIQNDGAPDPVLLRSLFAMRSRFAEDQLAEASARGVCQYVILGAGLDTFPWRQPQFALGMRLFAADHPLSLAFAQERFRAAGLPKPPNLTQLAIDLEIDNARDQLSKSGFDFTLPAFISMLGVAQYLSAGAFDAVLNFVASLRKGSEIVFSFALNDDALSGYDLEASTLSAALTASVGEPWRTKLHPNELVARLRNNQFRHVFHLTPQAAHDRYFAGRPDKLRAPGWEQLIAAIV